MVYENSFLSIVDFSRRYLFGTRWDANGFLSDGSHLKYLRNKLTRACAHNTSELFGVSRRKCMYLIVFEQYIVGPQVTVIHDGVGLGETTVDRVDETLE